MTDEVTKADNTIQYLKRIKKDPWKPVAKGCDLKPGTMRKAMDFIMASKKPQFGPREPKYKEGETDQRSGPIITQVKKDLPTSQGGRIKLLNDRAKDASANRAKMTMTDEDISEVAQKAFVKGDWISIVERYMKKAKENPSWKAAEGKIVSMIEGRKK